MKAKGEKVVCLTAYDILTATIADESEVDLVLVGDSLGNVVQGNDTTVPVTLDNMAYHTTIVRRGVKHALLVSDMPFGSYQASVAQAVDSATVLARLGAEAVKLEGPYYEEVAAIVKAGLPVMGHIGMTPQSVNQFGGFKVQGKGEAVKPLVEMAKRLEDAGVFSIVLELMSSEAAQEVTSAISCPTIGIGAGAGCDGQIQVFHDITGLNRQRFKHAKAFCQGHGVLMDGVQQYVKEVRSSTFPGEEHSF